MVFIQITDRLSHNCDPLLINRHELLTRNLTKKLLTYAIGRELEIGDRPEVDRIAKGMTENGKGLRDLIHLIVLSDVFRNN